MPLGSWVDDVASLGHSNVMAERPGKCRASLRSSEAAPFQHLRRWPNLATFYESLRRPESVLAFGRRTDRPSSRHDEKPGHSHIWVGS